jgi:hypothetical protein
MAHKMITFLSFGAFAQSDVASISGFVRDASGSVVPEARVTIKNEGVEFERALLTNNEGYYYGARANIQRPQHQPAGDLYRRNPEFAQQTGIDQFRLYDLANLG